MTAHTPTPYEILEAPQAHWKHIEQAVIAHRPLVEYLLDNPPVCLIEGAEGDHYLCNHCEGAWEDDPQIHPDADMIEPHEEDCEYLKLLKIAGVKS